MNLNGQFYDTNMKILNAGVRMHISVVVACAVFYKIENILCGHRNLIIEEKAAINDDVRDISIWKFEILRYENFTQIKYVP